MVNMASKASPTKYEIVETPDGREELVMRFPIVPKLSNSEKSMGLATTGGAETFIHPKHQFEMKMNINVYVPIQQWNAVLDKARKSK